MSFVSKSFIYLAVLMTVVLVCLWYVGGNKVNFEGRIEIRATPEEVFIKLVEPAWRQQWQTGVTQVELITKPPVAVESRYRTERELPGGSTEIRERVLQFQTARWLSIQAEMPPGLRTSIFELTRVGDQTILQYTITEQPLGWHRMAAPFRSSEAPQQIESELLKIKQLVESDLANDPQAKQ